MQAIYIACLLVGLLCHSKNQDHVHSLNLKAMEEQRWSAMLNVSPIQVATLTDLQDRQRIID